MLFLRSNLLINFTGVAFFSFLCGGILKFWAAFTLESIILCSLLVLLETFGLQLQILLLFGHGDGRKPSGLGGDGVLGDATTGLGGNVSNGLGGGVNNGMGRGVNNRLGRGVPTGLGGVDFPNWSFCFKCIVFLCLSKSLLEFFDLNFVE